MVSVGGTYDKKRNFLPSFVLFTVVEVGESDLLVREYPDKRFAKTGKVSKCSCIKIEFEKDLIRSSTTLSPQIGDLVLSYSESRFNETEIATGILYSITYEMSKPSTCKILCGEEIKVVPYSSLMVLQSGFEQVT